LQVWRWIDVQERIVGVLYAVAVARDFRPEAIKTLFAVAVGVGIHPQAESIRLLRDEQKEGGSDGTDQDDFEYSLLPGTYGGYSSGA
jgi:hypothetical protein